MIFGRVDSILSFKGAFLPYGLVQITQVYNWFLAFPWHIIGSRVVKFGKLGTSV